MVDLAGKQLGTYQMEALIGRGGMASVYKAYHPPTDRYVAVKVMLPEIATETTFQQRFEREAKTLAGLQHIHVLPVFDYGHQDGVSYLVIPYLPGRTLEDLLQERQLSSAEISRVFRQLASAVDYAHSKGVLHRDLKPENILLDEHENVLLADFGLTRLLDDGRGTAKLTSDSTVIGTPAYMSPEQGQGLPLDHRSDLYSLTVVLYEMLTGKVPYTADTPVAVIFKHISDPFPPPTTIREALPDAVDQVIEKGMAKAPADRFENATRIADALDLALNDEPVDTILHEKRKRPDGEMNTEQADLLAAAEAVYQADTHDDTVIVTEADIKRKRQPRRLSVVAAVAVLTVLVAGGVMAFYLTMAPAAPSNAPDFVLPAHEEAVQAMAVNGDGSRLLTSGSDEKVYVWSLETGEALRQIEGHSADVFDVELNPNGQEAITSERGMNSHVWDITTGEMKQTNMDPGMPNYAYSPDGNLVAAATGISLAVPLFWQPDADTQAAFAESMLAFQMPYIPSSVTHPTQEDFTALTFSPMIEQGGRTSDGRAITHYDLITGDTVGTVHRWQVAVEEPLASPEDVLAMFETADEMEAQMSFIDYRYASIELADKALHGEESGIPITAITLDNQGARFATANQDGLVIIWSLGAFDQTRIFPGSDYGAVYDIAFSADSSTLAIATEAVDVLLYDVETSSITQEMAVEEGDIRALTYTPQGALVAGADNGNLYIWDFDDTLALTGF